MSAAEIRSGDDSTVNSGPLKVLVIVLIILIILVAAGIIFGYYYLIKKEVLSSSSPQTTTTQISQANLNDLSTYTSKSYGFSFKYPASWIKDDDQSKTSDQKDLISSVGFLDPAREKEIDISLCLMNEDVDWANPTPTQESCSSLLAGLTSAQRKNLNQMLHSRNLFVKVYKAGNPESLGHWLTDYYQSFGGELADYAPGPEITLGGQPGRVSSIGCCGDYNLSYVVQNGDYIYMFGTNYGEADNGNQSGNSLLDQYKSSFKFTQ